MHEKEDTVMKDLILSQQYALIALDGLESLHPSLAKSAVIRAIAAAKVLEDALPFDQESDFSDFHTTLEEALQKAKNLKKKDEKEIEKEISSTLEADGLLEEVPDILGCDINYYTSKTELKAYRSEEAVYLRLTEGLRAELLEEGEISIECAILLWLLRESGCLHDLFSLSEQNQIHKRMIDLCAENEIYRSLWQAEFHSVMESFSKKFLKAKDNVFKNPYLEGINLLFPYMERRKSIFIDFVVLGTNVKERRIAVMEFLGSMGHYVQEVKIGSETLLKVDNTSYYRIFPTTRRVCRIPIQGANLVPAYW